MLDLDLGLIANLSLAGAGIALAAYCAVLSRRLHRLTAAGDGLVATLAEMDGRIAALRAGIAETRAASARTIEELDEMIGEGAALAEHLSELIETAGGAPAGHGAHGAASYRPSARRAAA
ncbi:MAG: hypothetical protein LPL00_09780 [Alphaproteobacteria bacterium]|nr:hypothetical protein [Alphaproteobacteria bacterium]MDX5369962.1 hypothetical protein [Alphaproteobacteria bacterium]MDX5464537.1 hypothetical protein [Alphaproteobacteria bacterium]